MCRRLVIVFLIVVVSACGPPGPVHKLRHTLTPPKTDAGKACAKKCQNEGTQCLRDAGARKADLGMACEERARDRAKIDYRDYVQTRTAKGKRVKKTEDDFYNDWDCSSEGHQLPDLCIT